MSQQIPGVFDRIKQGMDEARGHFQGSVRCIRDVVDEYDLWRDRQEFLKENPEQEYCPVCGEEIEPGERYCSTQCELRAIRSMYSEDENADAD